jgi:L-amino acid N-acyltransferase YncA
MDTLVFTIRAATPLDGPAIAEIYGPYVAETAITFEVHAPTAAEMADRIRNVTEVYPWLVAERAGQVIGYAYASRHRERDAYLWSVDVTVYVHPSAHRQGVGQALYSELLEIARKQGFHSAYAGITVPNPASVGLHEAMGFKPVGVYENVGYKLGAWRHVGWWALALAEPSPDPQPPIPFPEIARGDS